MSVRIGNTAVSPLKSVIYDETNIHVGPNAQLQTYFDNMIRTGADVQLRVVDNLTHDNIVRDNTPGIDDTIVNWFNMN